MGLQEDGRLSAMDKKLKITRDGPILVSGGLPLYREAIVADANGDPLEWRRVEELEAGESYALCRCGASKNKPFCDGSHISAGFDGTETARRVPYSEMAELYRGPGVDLTDAMELCAVARFCHRAGGIWALVEGSDDPVKKGIAIEEAGNCPSGRLVAWDKEAGKPIEPDFEPSVSITEDPLSGVSGPIWVKGGVPVESADGHVYEVRNRVTLCRCGRSGNKPFCNGAHIRAGFDDGHINE
ncbi:MAG: iron-binding protein [Methanobacteriota archaeon]|nr:MAG: iron-binding protein [Euryarchaeota archaeon]